ncbi:MAG: succinate dehydrogenase cytochrome b subunit [Rhodothermales bacterium]
MANKDNNGKPGLWSAMTSPIGKKLLTGLTGLGWVLFVILHMAGNLGYFGAGEAYNEYTEALMSLGPLLYLIETLLVAGLVIHVVAGVNIYLGKRRARKQGYEQYESAGRPSRQSLSSRSMIVTGIVLLVFLVIHINTFKFGPGIAEGYAVTVGGEEIRDLKRLVTEKFQNPLYAFGYTGVMLLLGFHLRHGIWSAFQSLGAMNRRLTPLVYAVGTVLAIGIVLGFLVLPLYIFFAA